MPNMKPWSLYCGVLFLLIASSLSSQAVFSGPRDYIVGSYPDSVVIGDFNGDGRPDLASANQYSNNISVLLQNSDGTFAAAVEYGVGKGPVSLQVGDVNGDGKLDLIVLNSQDSTLSVLIGNGNGTFQAQKVTSVPLYLGGQSLAVGDFNGDGYLDVALGMPLPQVGTYGVGVLLGNGDGTFKSPVSYALPAQSIALSAADVNNDLKLDLVVTNGNTTSNAVSVLLGNGDGTFQAATNTSLTFTATGLVVADFNQDGKLDVATSTGSPNATPNSLVLLLGNGNGTFQVQQPLSLIAVPLVAGDLNGDGKTDLIAATGALDLPNNGTLQSLVNNGNGTFTLTQSLPGSVAALSDLKTTGKLDLIAGEDVGGSPGTGQSVVSVFQGNGDGTFAIFPSYPGGGSLAAADLNSDGKIDLAEAFDTLSEGSAYTPFVGWLLNTGAGFSAPTVTQLQTQNVEVGSIFVGTADFNSDGHIDLAVAASDIATLLGNGDGTFQPAVYYGSGVGGPIAIGDFNNDGKLDVFGASGTNVSVILGNGNGTFGLPVTSPAGGTVYPTSGVAVADFNQDKNLDVAVSLGKQLAVLLGDGNGTFSSGITYTSEFQQTAVASGDLNGDGIPDLIVAVSSGTDVESFPASVVVLLGKGDGTFQSPITTYAGDSISSIVVADFDGDGKQDVAISNSTWEDVSLLLGNGDGTFQAPMQFTAGGGAMAVGDFDGNGSPDLAVSGAGGISLLLSAGKKGSAAFVSPTSLAFKSQYVGMGSSSQSVTLTNTEGVALTITSIAITGAQASDFSQTNNCGSSLTAGGSCTVNVTFTPAAAGNRAAALTFTNNAINTPQSVALTGTGLGFSLTATSSTQTISPGQTATYSINVTPAGGFNQAVHLTCTGAPAQSSCSVSPSSFTLNGSAAQTATVTVTTVGASSGLTLPWFGPRPGNPYGLKAWCLATLGLAALLGSFSAHRKWTKRWVYGFVFMLVLNITACGGGSSGGEPARAGFQPAHTV